ncbi:MAG: glutamine synthetase beta-grasp domain-containing protein [Oscillospiraceae bacterium]|jgi:glutamine synthetase|nr:glutamine synthetase beta-grasp domain-containing protein [Oscillospiraceae bacterium]
MNTITDVLKFIHDRDNDVKFVRLAFCDANGVPKNISVPPATLDAAFKNGMRFEPQAIPGFGAEYAEAYLFPDAATLAILPWRPSHGRVVRFYCDIKLADGTPAPFDARASLKRAIADADKAGLTFTAEPEIDFYLFKSEEDGENRGVTFDNGGYFDVYPNDMGENVRREICSHLTEMGITPTSSHHARGAGQNTIALAATDPLTCADNLLTFRMTVGTVAGQNGLAASFDEKPFKQPQASEMKIKLGCAKRGDGGYTETVTPSVNPYTEMEKLVKSAVKYSG